jgi:hypothetical protein
MSSAAVKHGAADAETLRTLMLIKRELSPLTTTSKNLLASLRWMSTSYTLTRWRAGASDAAQVTALRCAVQCGVLRRRRITFAHTGELGGDEKRDVIPKQSCCS